MPNRLQHATSPYLLQHAHNPVDWHPWDAEALALARSLDRPIFLSIGYSACHWCHVMERESFEDEAVAAVLNAQFVPIKVDREERPDLDDLYMEAVTSLTGRGGWPMSVWLTPDLKPFYGGTYFPPESRYGMPGFLPLLQRIAELWRTRRADVAYDAEALATRLRRAEEPPKGGLAWHAAVEAALTHFRQAHDPRLGGFGPAPKFPPHGALALILAHGDAADRERAFHTLEAMARGGIHDHVGGGFARYSVDAEWHIPHFEKMLYDNAQLATAYLAAHVQQPGRGFSAVAHGIFDYLLRDLRDPAGGFHSAEDADSEGEEGRFYAWTPEQVAAVLLDRAPAFCEAFDVTEEGNFEHGTSVLRRLREGDFAADLACLRLARECRVRPGKDDKVLASWNGLALSALCQGAQVLGREDCLRAAQELGRFLKGELWREGVLLRAWRGGHGHTQGFLEDYAAVAAGLVDLYETDFDAGWLDWAEVLVEALLARFADAGDGGLYVAAGGQDDLLVRQRARHDNALPSGATLALGALLRVAAHRDRDDLRSAAARAAHALGTSVGRLPFAFAGFLAAAAPLDQPGVELTLRGDLSEGVTRALLREAHATWQPGRHLRWATGGQESPSLTLCEAGSCGLPLTDPREVRRRLQTLVEPSRAAHSAS